MATNSELRDEACSLSEQLGEPPPAMAGKGKVALTAIIDELRARLQAPRPDAPAALSDDDDAPAASLAESPDADAPDTDPLLDTTPPPPAPPEDPKASVKVVPPPPVPPPPAVDGTHADSAGGAPAAPPRVPVVLRYPMQVAPGRSISGGARGPYAPGAQVRRDDFSPKVLANLIAAGTVLTDGSSGSSGG